MTDKPEYYELLNVARTATEDEIKKAFGSFTFKNHPDRKKTPEEKEKAKELQRQAQEARDVLLDPKLRAIYDQRGHKGLEDAAKGRSHTDFSGNKVVAVHRTETESAVDWFKKGKETRENAEGKKLTPRPGPRKFERAERTGPIKNNTETPAEEFNEVAEEKPVVNRQTTDFSAVGNMMNDVADKIEKAMSIDAGVPEKDIEEFKKALQKFSKVLDDAQPSRGLSIGGLKF